MKTHSCKKCGALVFKHNKTCLRCGAAVSAKPFPVFWFMFTAWLFVAYAAMNYMHIV